MFFDSTSPWRNRVSSALVGAFGSGERRSRLRPRRCARGGLLAIDHLIERLEDRKLLDASSISHPCFIYNSGSGSLQSSSPVGFTPAQIQKAYGIDSLLASGNGGQGQTVAIVDGYDWPTAATDLHNFDVQFGLPDPPSFTKVNEFGNPSPLPPVDPSGPGPNSDEVETALDVEWVHSIAPKASIILVECETFTAADLQTPNSDVYKAIDTAANLPGVSVVSMSFGIPEFNGEQNLDSNFLTPPGHQNVTFLASTGDSGAPGEYPAYSPNVVAVGGTTLTIDSSGNYISESGWSLGSDPGQPNSASGGGVSLYEPTPSFQSSNGVNYGARSIPDVSWLADPNIGVYIVDTLDAPGEILIAGGTSLAAPMWAGLIALGDQARGSAGSLSSTGVLDSLYGAYNSSNYSADFHDITVGNNGFAAGPGYDLVTGIGTPKAQNIVNLLGTVLPPAVSIGSPTVNTGSSAGLSNVDSNAEKSVSVYSKPLSPISINSVFTDGALSDFVTTVDIPKAKKIGSLLFS